MKLDMYTVNCKGCGSVQNITVSNAKSVYGVIFITEEEYWYSLDMCLRAPMLHSEPHIESWMAKYTDQIDDLHY